jgi:hypothetical protein
MYIRNGKPCFSGAEDHPTVSRHDAAVTSDGVQHHNFIEAIGGVDFQMRCGRL